MFTTVSLVSKPIDDMRAGNNNEFNRIQGEKSEAALE
jgi:hypothetical protein